MRYYTFNGNSLMEPSLYTGPLPIRVAFGLVATDAFDGKYTKSLFKFQSFGVTDVNLKMNGKCVTNVHVRINMAENDYLPFFWMFRSTGGLFANNEPITDYLEYGKGHFIYSFDLVQDSPGLTNYKNLKTAHEILISWTENASLRDIGLLTPYMVIDTHALIYPEGKNLFTAQKATYVGRNQWKYYPKILNRRSAYSTLQALIDLHNGSLEKIENTEDLISQACKCVSCLTNCHFFIDGNGRLARLLLGYILQKKYQNWITLTCPQEKFVEILLKDQRTEDCAHHFITVPSEENSTPKITKN